MVGGINVGENGKYLELGEIKARRLKSPLQAEARATGV
jgi:hypothetical protein